MKNTVKSYSHFKFIMNSGRKTVLSHSVIYTIPHTKLQSKWKSYTGTAFAYGIMVTTKIGKAVTRNQIKRQIRIIIGKITIENQSVIIVPRHSFLNTDINKITEEIHLAVSQENTCTNKNSK